MLTKDFAHLLFRLSNINKTWLDFLCDFKVVHFKRGETIPASPDHFYFLKKGLIRTSSVTVSGVEWIFIFQKSGCLFNELAVLEKELNIVHTCQTNAEIYILPISLLSDVSFLRTNPHLIMNFLETIALKEALAYSYTFDLALLSARGRFCQALLALVKEHPNKPVFSPNVTQSEIASMMGLHSTTAMRILKQLRQAGVIGTFTKKKLEILSFEKLQAFGQEYEDRPCEI